MSQAIDLDDDNDDDDDDDGDITEEQDHHGTQMALHEETSGEPHTLSDYHRRHDNSNRKI